MTVLPYLFDHYYDTDDSTVQYFTERELNGNFSFLFFFCIEEFFLEENMKREAEQNNGSAQTNQSSKRRWKKPISCIAVRKIPGCKQS